MASPGGLAAPPVVIGLRQGDAIEECTTGGIAGFSCGQYQPDIVSYV